MSALIYGIFWCYDFPKCNIGFVELVGVYVLFYNFVCFYVTCEVAPALRYAGEC